MNYLKTSFSCRYFKNTLNIVCEFIPQMIFLCFLFLYMVVMMFIKWLTFWATNDRKFFFFFLNFFKVFFINVFSFLFSAEFVQYSPHCAPSILITFINMVLFKSSKVDEACSPEMFSGQMQLQKVLVICALLCVPWMFLAKPIIIMRRQKEGNTYAVNFNNSIFQYR